MKNTCYSLDEDEMEHSLRKVNKQLLAYTLAYRYVLPSSF